MPDTDAGSLEVSKEEERYLRRAFRRFALPYVIAVLAGVGVWGAVAGFRLGPAHDPGESKEFQGLIAESASLREAISALRRDVDSAAARAEEGVTRVSSLERRVAKISDATEAVGAPSLRKRLDQAHQRINALDASLTAVTEAARANTQDRERAVDARAPASSGTAGSWPADALP
jgi:hypothetical protein